MLDTLYTQLRSLAAESENERCYLAIAADGHGIVYTKLDIVFEFDSAEQLVSGLAQASETPYLQKQLGNQKREVCGGIRF